MNASTDLEAASLAVAHARDSEAVHRHARAKLQQHHDGHVPTRGDVQALVRPWYTHTHTHKHTHTPSYQHLHIEHTRMGCREETWVMVNTFKVDEARGTV
jgi:hypothetical protein